MRTNKRQKAKFLKISGLFLVYITGLLSIVATGGGSGGGGVDPGPTSPPNTQVGSVQFDATSYAVGVGDSLTVSVTVRNTENEVITNPSLVFSLSQGTLASVNQSGVIVGVASGVDQLTVSSGGVASDPADVFVLESRPFAWPVDRMRTGGASSLLSQGYAEFGDVVSGSYHTGMDVRVEVPAGYVPGQESGVSDSQVRAVASGYVHRIQRTVSETENPNPTPDHDMGNTIVLAHQMEAARGGHIFSQYSHLADDGFGQGLLEEAIELARLDQGCSSGRPATIDGEADIDSEYICEPGVLVVSKGALLGNAGDTGETGTVDAPFFLHLHYELKFHDTLGNVSDSSWGYTAARSLSQEGYIDPVPYFFGDYTVVSEILQVTEEGATFPTRMGPGGHVESVGTRTINGRYRSIGHPLVRGARFTSVAEIGEIEGLLANYDNSTETEVACDQGWVALRNLDLSTRFVDNAEGGAGEFDVVWACLGHGTVNYLEPATSIAAPTGLSAVTQSTSEIRITWLAPSGAASYSVYRGGSTTPVSTGTSTEYLDSGLQAGTEYCYQVRALDDQGNPSPLSEEACATTGNISDTVPPSPFTLTATVVSNNQIDLSWTESIDETSVVRYEVFRNQDPNPIQATSALAYSDVALSASTEYCYFVTAYDGSENATNSNQVCATTHADIITLDPPTIESVIRVGDTALEVTWSNPAANIRVDVFRLFRNGAEVFSGNALTYLDEQLTPNSEYCYRVRAELSSGAISDLSGQVCGTTATGVGVPELAITSVFDQVEDGTLLTVTITVSNSSATQSLTGVVLDAVTPTYMNVATSSTSPTAACLDNTVVCEPGISLQWIIGSLQPGEQYIARYSDVISIGAIDSGPLTAEATVMADGIAAKQDTHAIVASNMPPPYQVAVSADDNPAAPGDEIVFRVRYMNRSTSLADQLTLTLPEGVTFLSASDGGSAVGQLVSWPISVVSGHDGFKEVTAIIDAGIDEGSLLRAEARFGTGSMVGSGAHVLSVHANPPLELAVTTSVDPIEETSLVTTTLTVSNPSATDSLTGVVLEAITPNLMSVGTSSTSPTAVCLDNTVVCESGNVLQWSLGTLPPGEQRVVRFGDVVGIGADNGDQLSAEASVRAVGVSIIQDTVTVVYREPRPLYQVTVSADDNPAAPGEQIVFRVRYSNRSTSMADKLTLSLPDGVTFVSATDGGSAVGQLVSWPVTVPAGDDGFKEATAIIGAGVREGSLLRAEAAFGSGDAVAAGGHVVAVNTDSPLELAVTTSADPADDGALLTVTMTVSNRSPVQSLTGVVLEAVTPNWMSVGTSATSPTAVCLDNTVVCESGNVMQWNLGDLQPGEQRVVRYGDSLPTNPDDGEPLLVEAAATADGVSTIQDTQAIVIADPRPPYQVAVSGDDNPAVPGERVVFRLRYSNRSSTTADKLTLSLPDGMTFVSATGGGSAVGQLVSWPVMVVSGDDGFAEVTASIDAGVDEGSLLRVEAAFGSGDTVGSGAHIVGVNTNSPLELDVTTSADPAGDNALLTVTMVVSNSSTTQAVTGVLLEAVTPVWMRVATSSTSPTAICLDNTVVCEPGNILQWDLGTLQPGEQRVVRFADNLPTNPGDGELLHMEAAVTANGVSTVQDVQTIAFADSWPPYQVALSIDDDPAAPGEQVVLRVRYSNRSTSAADQLTLSLPDGVTFVSATHGGSAVGQLVSWPVVVAAGDDGSTEVTAIIDSSVRDASLLRVKATFGSGNTYASGAYVLSVNENPPIELAITTTTDPVQSNSLLTVTMTVRNPNSTQPLTGVVLEAVTPAYMTVSTSSTSPTAICLDNTVVCEPGNVLQWNLGTLQPGEQVVVEYSDTVSMAAPDGAPLNADAAVTADGISTVQDTLTIIVSD